MAAAATKSNPLLAAAMGAFAVATGAYVYHKRQQRFIPPVAERKEHKLMIGSHPHSDDLYWLRDDKRKAPAMIKHLERENVYSAAMMEHTSDLQSKLYAEFVSHLKEDDTEVPYAWDNYVYYKTTIKGLNYPRYCRKCRPTDPSIKTIAENKNPEQIILDVNELARGHVFCSVQSVTPSPNHDRLCYAIDTNGYEQYEIHVIDLTNGGKPVGTAGDIIKNASGSVEWSDNDTLYYTTLDEAHRPYRLHRHRLGTDSATADSIVFEEKDEKFWVGFYRSLSGEYLFVDSSSKITSEVWFLRTADDTKSDVKLSLFQARSHDVLYSVDHTAGQFWVVTNRDGAKNFKLLRTPTVNGGGVVAPPTEWQTVIAHNTDRKIDHIDCFKSHVVVFGRFGGFSDVSILSATADGKQQPFTLRTLKFPETVFTCEHGKNRDYNSSYVRVVYESYTTPDSTFDVDLASGVMTRVKELEVPGGYDRTKYSTELIHATAADGTKVPITMVYRTDKRVAGKSSPTLLYGYGSYGICYDPQFDSKRLSLLDRGLIVATAHIRGGGEMGRYWYESGKWLTKKNTFTDFIACAEHLIATGYTTTPQLAISGGSAGGLLMGAVLNLKPQLFKCVLTRVPFVDVLVTMSDPSIPLTVTEYEEWGNPADDKYYQYMKEYSPIDNVSAQAYPAMLVTSGLNDSRVAFWEPTKWVQKLRAIKTDSNPILFKCEMIQGHGGSSARYAYMEEAAYNFAFILDQLGFKK